MFNFRSLFRYNKNVYTVPKKDSKQAELINKQKARVLNMREKLESQKKNIENNTPRIASGIVALFTLPTLYYGYQMMCSKYEDIEFYENIRCGTDWINMKLSMTCGILGGLQFMRFIDQKAKNILVPKTRGIIYLAIPLLGSLLSYSFIDSLQPYQTLATIGNVVGTLVIFSHAVNIGAVPFWLFALMYQMFSLDLILTLMNFFAMRNLNSHRAAKPKLYTQYQ